MNSVNRPIQPENQKPAWSNRFFYGGLSSPSHVTAKIKIQPKCISHSLKEKPVQVHLKYY